jgi:hypothetical protein
MIYIYNYIIILYYSFLYSNIYIYIYIHIYIVIDNTIRIGPGGWLDLQTSEYGDAEFLRFFPPVR